MTGRARITAISGGVSILVLIAVVGAALWVAQSEWLFNKVRTGIIAEAEAATGGKVELGSFRFDWRTLTAEVDRFVIHGTEAAGADPLLSVDRVVARLRIVSLFNNDIRIVRIEADRPRAHLIIDADGRTNLPEPRSKKPVAEKILDLRIANFDLKNGSILTESPGRPSRSIPWSARGENLAAVVTFDAAGPRYSGDVSLAPLHFDWNGSARVDLQVDAHASMERNRIVVANAKLKTTESEIDLKDAVLDNFSAPVTTGNYEGRVSLSEMARIFKLKGRQAGTLNLAGNARFVSLAEYRVTGNFRGAGIDADRLRSMRVAGFLDAVPNRITLNELRVAVLGGEIVGHVQLKDLDRFQAAGQLEHFDLQQLAALDVRGADVRGTNYLRSTRMALPYDGLISGPFDASGRLVEQMLESVALNVHASISPAATGAAMHGDVTFHYEPAAGRIELSQSWVELPNTRVDASGTLGGRLDLKVASRDVNDLLPVLEMFPGGKTVGITWTSMAFTGNVVGPVENPRIAGHVAGQEVRYNGQQIDSFTGDITASQSQATVSNSSVVWGDLHLRGAGSLGLRDWIAGPTSPIAANVQITNADLTKIMAIAGHPEIEVSGTVNTTAQIAGSVAQPLANADVSVTKGFIYGQPFDSISGRSQYIDRNTQTLTGLFVSGPKRVNIGVRFEHAGTQFPAGNLEFNLTSNTMPLNEIALVRRRQPDIHGFGKFHADGAIKINHDSKHAIQLTLSNLNADASANGLELAGRDLGDARFTTQTKNDIMTARFDSNAAKASIHGEGKVQLTGDYPVNGTVTFSNAGLNALAALIATPDEAKTLSFDGTAGGQASFTGPVLKPAQLQAELEVPQLELRALPGTSLAQSLPNFVVRNTEPIRISLNQSMLRIERARFQAPETDISFEGTVALTQENPFNVRAQGNVNLALARTFSPDLTSSGELTVSATVRGGWRTPDLSGRAAIRNGDFHYAGFSNGLTKATGEIVFNGTRANIQSFTAESGGGKVDATGFAALANGLLAFRIEANAHETRVRYPEGVSSVSDAAITLAGTSQRSEASGSITVHRVAINPKLDASTILALSAEPINTPSVKTGLAANMNLDIQIETAPDVALQTSVTQSIQADANLRLRGTATNPALLGRINITQGDLIFFGSKYTITQGSISFFNPAKIDPILNVDLETKARGVDVILTVSGPIDKLNVSYRSDPPLQFSDILALLATGRAPTDPTLSIPDTGQSQNFQSLGASALIGQALANPVAGRLQRFFGVSRLKIDPQLTGITGSPEARLTIEQQVTPDILFTYITDVSSTSTQLIRVEWSFNPRWSAILIREENGYVGLDFAYKKRFR